MSPTVLPGTVSQWTGASVSGVPQDVTRALNTWVSVLTAAWAGRGQGRDCVSSPATVSVSQVSTTARARVWRVTQTAGPALDPATPTAPPATLTTNNTSPPASNTVIQVNMNNPDNDHKFHLSQVVTQHLEAAISVSHVLTRAQSVVMTGSAPGVSLNIIFK